MNQLQTTYSIHHLTSGNTPCVITSLCMYIGSADLFRFPLTRNLLPNFHPTHTRARWKIYCMMVLIRWEHRVVYVLLKNDCYVYYYIYHVCWYRYRICIAQLTVFTKDRKSTSLTIFLLLFVLGISIGSNSLIINDLGRFGWQAAILATLSILGSMLASFLVFHLFLRKEADHER